MAGELLIDNKIATNEQLEVLKNAVENVGGFPSGKLVGPAAAQLAALDSQVAARNFRPIPNTIVVFGSSSGAGRGASTYTADPSSANGYTSPPTSWAGLLATALGNTWTVINRSLSGTGTGTSIARFWEDVAPHRPSHVILCTHPLNDNFDTRLYYRNTVILARMCEAIGAVPILRGAYMYNGYTPAQYQDMLALNRQLDRLPYHRIDHFSTLDNGSGGFVGGNTYLSLPLDGLHCNDLGQAVQFRSIDIGMLQYGASRRVALPTRTGVWSPSVSTGSAIVLAPAQGLPLTITSWTMRARIKSLAGVAQAKAFLSAYAQNAIGNNPVRLRNAVGTYDIADISSNGPVSSVNSVTDNTPHDLVMSYNEATNLIAGYVDGVSFGTFTPAVTMVAVNAFAFGGRAEAASIFPAMNYQFSDLQAWRVALRPEDVADMARSGMKPPASLIFDADMSARPSGVASGGFVPNLVANGMSPVFGEVVWTPASAF